MILAGLLCTGAGLLLLVAVQLLQQARPKNGLQQSKGIVLEVKEAAQCITVNFLLGSKTVTTTVALPADQRFYAGQQVLVHYAAEKPEHLLQIQSIRNHLGRKFLGLLLAALLILGGLLLLRLG